MMDERNSMEERNSNELEEDAWLRIFEDEIASSSRAAAEEIPSPQLDMPREDATDRDADSPAHTQRPGSGKSPAAQTSAHGARSMRRHGAGSRLGGRLGAVFERFKSGFANWRRGFTTLPRRSQRWVLIAGIAGVSAILWGVLAPSSPGPQGASTAELLAQAQMSNSVLKRQLQQLSAELQTGRTEREQLLNEVDALTEERDWLAARLDAVASAGTPIIEGAAPPAADPSASSLVDSKASSPAVEEPNVPAGRDYEVGRGDTLWSIARRHNVDVKQLAAVNGIGLSDSLKVGQRIVVPDGQSQAVADTQKSTEQAVADDAIGSSERAPRQVEYTVKRGDSLYGISRQFDVSVEQLQAWNSLGKGEVLRPSQRLIVYVDGAASARALP
jgi:LysM repeat protein